MIRVADPGLLTTVQDAGRWGCQHLGVPVAGPMDPLSHRAANLLVGNPADRAALEVTLVGPDLEFLDDTVFAVAGARFDLRLDGKPLRAGVAARAARGSRLRFGRRTAGARAYVAVRGGVDVPPRLGSRSTDLASRFGGLGGRPLRSGDRLDVGPSGGAPVPRPRPDPVLPLPAGGARVRFMPGADGRRFEDRVLERVPDCRFIVGPDSNRMGYRLRGASIELADPAPVLSSATPPGTIQVPPAGRPILLMADRQTTGGYAVLGTVITADLGVAGQLAPGDWIAFDPCGRGEAAAALAEMERRLKPPAPSPRHDGRRGRGNDGGAATRFRHASPPDGRAEPGDRMTFAP